MRRYFIITSAFLLCLLLSSCSNTENKKVDPTSIISNDCYTIIKPLEPDKRIDDFFKIASVLQELPNKTDKELPNDLNFLIEKSYEYNVTTVEDRLERIKDGKMSSIGLKDNSNIRLYKYQYWDAMILPTFTDKNSYEYPLEINLDSIISIANSDGYLNKIVSTSNADKFTWYYKDVKITNNNISGKGSSFAVLTDFHGNIMEVFIPPINGSYSTINNLPLLIKNSNLQDNKYLREILTKDELQKASMYFYDVNQNVLEKYIMVNENGVSALIANVGDKKILFVNNNNHLDISVANKNEQNSKYVKDLNTLRYMFTPEENKPKESNYKPLEIDSTSINQDSNKMILNKITLEQGLEILKSKVTPPMGFHFDPGELRNIDGKPYYLYTVSDENTTPYAYCVDVDSGKLYKCSNNMILTPID